MIDPRPLGYQYNTSVYMVHRICDDMSLVNLFEAAASMHDKKVIDVIFSNINLCIIYALVMLLFLFIFNLVKYLVYFKILKFSNVSIFREVWFRISSLIVLLKMKKLRAHPHVCWQWMIFKNYIKWWIPKYDKFKLLILFRS